jgi:hypothetical protein
MYIETFNEELNGIVTAGTYISTADGQVSGLDNVLFLVFNGVLPQLY